MLKKEIQHKEFVHIKRTRNQFTREDINFKECTPELIASL